MIRLNTLKSKFSCPQQTKNSDGFWEGTSNLWILRHRLHHNFWGVQVIYCVWALHWERGQHSCYPPYLYIVKTNPISFPGVQCRVLHHDPKQPWTPPPPCTNKTLILEALAVLHFISSGWNISSIPRWELLEQIDANHIMMSLHAGSHNLWQLQLCSNIMRMNRDELQLLPPRESVESLVCSLFKPQ